MSHGRILVMSFGLGGNAGDGISSDGNTYSSSWYLDGPDAFLRCIPGHYDPAEVDGCIVIDKRKCSRRVHRSRSDRHCVTPS